MSIVKSVGKIVLGVLVLACLLTVAACLSSDEPTDGATEFHRDISEDSGEASENHSVSGSCPQENEPTVFRPNPQDSRYSRIPEFPWRVSATATGESITFEWDPISLDDVTGYRILRWIPWTDQFLTTDLGLVSGHVDTEGIEPSSEYRYWIFPIQSDRLATPTYQILVQTPVSDLPDEPRGVQASASPDAIAMSWARPTDESIEGYLILRRNASAGDEWQAVAEPSNETDSVYAVYSYTPQGVKYLDDEDIVPGARYEYVICAINPRGIGDASPVVEVTVPGADEIVIPAPENLNVEPTFNSVSLKWDPVAHADITGYEVTSRRLKFDDDVRRRITVAGGLTTAAELRAEASTHYEFNVRAIFPAGFGEFSEPVSVVTPPAPAADSDLPPKPQNLTAVPTHADVLLKWNVADDPTVQGYRVQRREIGAEEGFSVGRYNDWVAVDEVNETTDLNTYPIVRSGSFWLDHAAVKPETTYEYRVAAVNGNGAGEESDVVSATTLPLPDDQRRLPATPFDLHFVRIDEGVLLTWESPYDPSTEGFLVRVSKVDWDISERFTFVVKAPKRSFVYVDPNPTSWDGYSIYVQAFNSFGDSHASPSVWVDSGRASISDVLGWTEVTTTFSRVRLNTSIWHRVDEVDGLEILRREFAIDGFGRVSNLVDSEDAIKSFNYFDENVSQATLYWYEIRIYRGDKVSETIHRVALTKPGPPTTLQPIVTSSRTESDEVTLEWSRLDDSNVIGYLIRRSTNPPSYSSNWEIIASVAASTHRYVDRDVRPGNFYKYQIVRFTTAGEGWTSEAVEVRTPADPDLPSFPTNIRIEETLDTIKVFWDVLQDPSVTEYVVVRRGLKSHDTRQTVFEEVIRTGSTAPQWFDTEVVGGGPETSYYGSLSFQYTVWAADGDRIIARSNEMVTSRGHYDKGLILDEILAPGNLSHESTVRTVTLKWEMPCDATYLSERPGDFPMPPSVWGFQIVRSKHETIAYSRTLIAETPCDLDNTYVDSWELEPGATYQYTVRTMLNHHFSNGATIDVTMKHSGE